VYAQNVICANQLHLSLRHLLAIEANHFKQPMSQTEQVHCFIPLIWSLHFQMDFRILAYYAVHSNQSLYIETQHVESGSALMVDLQGDLRAYFRAIHHYQKCPDCILVHLL
jgi:hypothetical protein